MDIKEENTELAVPKTEGNPKKAEENFYQFLYGKITGALRKAKENREKIDNVEPQVAENKELSRSNDECIMELGGIVSDDDEVLFEFAELLAEQQERIEELEERIGELNA